MRQNELLTLAAVLVVGVVLLRPKKALAWSGGQPLGEIELASIGGGFQLRSDVADAFNAMKAAAAADGVVLSVNSAFRTYEKQAQLYEARDPQGDAVAKPGWSSHQQGVTVDIDVDRSTVSRAYAWLDRYATTYGFTNTGSSFGEPWHWEHTA